MTGSKWAITTQERDSEVTTGCSPKGSATFKGAMRIPVTREGGENISLPQCTNPAHTQLPSTSWSDYPKATSGLELNCKKHTEGAQGETKAWKTEQMLEIQLQEEMGQHGITGEVITAKVKKNYSLSHNVWNRGCNEVIWEYKVFHLKMIVDERGTARK